MDQPAASSGSIGKGVGIGALLTLAGALVSVPLLVVYIGYIMLVGIGLAQALWMVPAYRRYRKRGETETAKGLLIVAGLVFLLNASCWGVVVTNSPGLH